MLKSYQLLIFILVIWKVSLALNFVWFGTDTRKNEGQIICVVFDHEWSKYNMQLFFELMATQSPELENMRDVVRVVK